jgi:hypothetical protein
VVTLKTEATFLEQQLETLRSKHKQMRANGAVAAWEEKAIAQRHKRRQAEKANEQLRHALFLQSGFVRNLRSMFSEAMPCSIELNMRNFLHTPTRLLPDQRSRVRSLESVCTDAKLDMARQIILEETGGITAFTTPHISCQQIDLGCDGFGMTTVAVYALETRNACNTFKATCSAIMNCAAVWPGYSLVASSLKAADLPPTKLNIRYGMSHNVYQSDSTGDRVSVESREISYFRMAENCGVFLWDYVDADDDNPLQEETTAMRCTIGAYVASIGVQRLLGLTVMRFSVVSCAAECSCGLRSAWTAWSASCAGISAQRCTWWSRRSSRQSWSSSPSPGSCARGSAARSCTRPSRATRPPTRVEKSMLFSFLPDM